jgi:hypothetical protein
MSTPPTHPRPLVDLGHAAVQYWPSADSARWNDIERVAGFEPFVQGFLVEYAT